MTEPSENSRVTQPRLLVVEDEPGMRAAIEHFFRYHGFHVVTAETAEEAVDKRFGPAPDCVICDWRLPGRLDGVAVAKAFAGTPVIMMSSHGVTRVERALGCTEVTSIVAKPVALHELERIVCDTLAAESALGSD